MRSAMAATLGRASPAAGGRHRRASTKVATPITVKRRDRAGRQHHHVEQVGPQALPRPSGSWPSRRGRRRPGPRRGCHRRWTSRWPSWRDANTRCRPPTSGSTPQVVAPPSPSRPRLDARPRRVEARSTSISMRRLPSRSHSSSRGPVPRLRRTVPVNTASAPAARSATGPGSEQEQARAGLAEVVTPSPMARSPAARKVVRRRDRAWTMDGGSGEGRADMVVRWRNRSCGSPGGRGTPPSRSRGGGAPAGAGARHRPGTRRCRR